MKKAFVFLLFFCTISLAYAQESPQKLAKGRFQLELNFMPWDTDTNNLGIDQLTVKYKITNGLNLRMGLRYSSEKQNKDQDKIVNPDSYYNITEYESKQSLFGFMPGVEYHFLKNSRISPYVGLEFVFINKKTDYNQTTSSSSGLESIEIDGGLLNQEYVGSNYWTTYDKDRAYKSHGINLILGTDIYICKNFYAGFELGFGYERTKYKAISVYQSREYNENPGQNTVTNREIAAKTDKTTGIFYNNAIRIGVWF